MEAMCRFLLYMGPSTSLESLITQPENSLVHQSYKSKERKEALNGDGFGVAWYVGGIGPVPGRSGPSVRRGTMRT